jgi:hypothetical protein
MGRKWGAGRAGEAHRIHSRCRGAAGASRRRTPAPTAAAPLAAGSTPSEDGRAARQRTADTVREFHRRGCSGAIAYLMQPQGRCVRLLSLLPMLLAAGNGALVVCVGRTCRARLPRLPISSAGG